MNAIIKLIFLIGLVSFSLGEKTGVKISLNQETITQGARHFTGYILKELADIKVDDQHFKFDAGIGDLKVDVINIHLHITQFPAEKLSIQFQEPKTIVFNSDGIKGNGSFTVKLKLAFMSDTLPTTLEITNLVLHSNIDLTWEKSKSFPDKYIPAINVSKLDVDFDFDFDIHTKIIGNLIKLVKGKIKDEIKKIAKKEIHDKLQGDLHDMFSDIMNSVPLQPEIYKDICVDYSLVAEPYVKNGFIFINSRAQILNPKVEKTINPPFELVDIGTESGVLAKNVESLITTYVINTGIYTFTLSDELNISITDKDLPKESLFHLNTDSLDVILNGLKEKYGANKMVTLKFKVIEPVDGAKLSTGTIDVVANVEISVMVEGFPDPAAVFTSKIQSDVKLEIKPNADISVSISKLVLNSLELKESSLPTIDINAVKTLVNFTLAIGIRIIDETVLSKIKIKLPEYLGISFNDSALKLNADFIEVGVTPEFTPAEELLRDVIAKIKVRYLNKNNSLKMLLGDDYEVFGKNLR